MIQPVKCFNRAQRPRRGSAGRGAIILLAIVGCLSALAVWWFSDREESVDPDPPAQQQQASPTATEDTDVVLDMTRQEHIWHCEHKTFELEQRLGKRFRKAWTEGDSAALLSMLAEDCSASIVNAAPSTREHAGVTEEKTVAAADSDSSAATREQLAAFLVTSLEELEDVQRSRFKVLKIESHDDDRWTMHLLLDAYGNAKTGAPVLCSSEHDISCQFRSNEELETSAVIQSWNVAFHRVRRGEQPLFREVTAEFGLDALELPDNWTSDEEARQYQFQMAVDDFNSDGYLDIAVMTEQGMPYVLRSESGARFVDCTEDVLEINGHGEPSSGVCWIDYDNDGDPDLLIANRLFRNDEGKSFHEVTNEARLSLEKRPQGYNVVDYDCDGHLDLYCVYQHPYGAATHRKPPERYGWIGDHTSGGENQLWRNMGNGHFRNVTRETLAGGGFRHSFAASWFFQNDDHYPDIYVANDLGPNSLLRATGRGTFRDVTRQTKTGDFATSMGVATGDFNNDGNTEIYVANMYSKMGRRIIQQVDDDDYPEGIYDQIKGSCAGNRLYQLSADGESYEDIGQQLDIFAVGWAYAPAFSDFDNDGWLDIYATTGFLSFERNKPDG